MPRYLVASYSWTGNTAKVAKLIAETLSADFEDIREVEPRGGLFGFPTAIIASLLKRSPSIVKSTKNVADYDVVILGCPVWASNMAAPMRSYIMRENRGIKQVAMFCTLGGSGGKATLENMAALCGHPSLANLMVDRTVIASGAWRGLTESFAREIQAMDLKTIGSPPRNAAAA